VENLAVTELGVAAPAAEQEALARHARALQRRRGRNRMFGILLAVISLTMFAIVVALVIGFHALEAYRVIPGF
jgi:hypothetical protein